MHESPLRISARTLVGSGAPRLVYAATGFRYVRCTTAPVWRCNESSQYRAFEVVRKRLCTLARFITAATNTLSIRQLHVQRQGQQDEDCWPHVRHAYTYVVWSASVEHQTLQVSQSTAITCCATCVHCASVTITSWSNTYGRCNNMSRMNLSGYVYCVRQYI